MTDEEQKLRRNLAALTDYQRSMFRIGEDSEAADRELLRVSSEISAIHRRLREIESA